MLVVVTSLSSFTWRFKLQEREVSRPGGGVLGGAEVGGPCAGCGRVRARPGELTGAPGVLSPFRGASGLTIDFLASNCFSVSREGGMECNSAHALIG